MVQVSAVPGNILAERYRLEALLGQGGFGTVWRAEHLVLEAPVAIKLIAPEIARNEYAVERFMREAKAAASLRSPHVVQILDYGIHEDQPFTFLYSIASLVGVNKRWRNVRVHKSGLFLYEWWLPGEQRLPSDQVNR